MGIWSWESASLTCCPGDVHSAGLSTTEVGLTLLGNHPPDSDCSGLGESLESALLTSVPRNLWRPPLRNTAGTTNSTWNSEVRCRGEWPASRSLCKSGTTPLCCLGLKPQHILDFPFPPTPHSVCQGTPLALPSLKFGLGAETVNETRL